MSLLSIVVPCYNESLNLSKFYTCIHHQIYTIQTQINPKICYELIFINDGSTDDTLQILNHLQQQDESIKIINFSRNFGKESAILAGLQNSKGDAIVLIDADLQDPIELIFEMVQIYCSNKTDIVCVKRTNRKGESQIRAAFSEVFYKIAQLISEVRIQSGIRDFRLMSKEVVEAILSLKEYHRFSKAIFEWVGFKKVCLEYEYIPREAGISGWSFWKLFKYGIEGLVSFSTLPLRLAFIFGFIFSMVSFAYGAWIIIDTLIFGSDVKGYPSLMCAIIFLGGIQLMGLGIIGEYIARIYEQTKNRPHFIIKENYDFKE
ncbi:glycosyltransferase [Helicobacter sp. MIT 11-5569]|uniref:glycosyltransferase family 2 protein n=1 Tax=Helicobacter sp. MIT 11-5569 TaxID=1548151 RepID=UPI00051F919C|nr:glycosyltransferase family 2 protein [Helicobacter sp. MIT 11-5569]TLD83889.1 glycosyltransferase [Helicobacter sp. MIT 11-5569]